MSAYDSYLYNLMESSFDYGCHSHENQPEPIIIKPKENKTMTTQSLYDITNNHTQIMEMLNELEDLSTDSENNQETIAGLYEALAITEADFNQKAVSYCQIIRNEEAAAEAIDSEIKRLQNLKKSRENKANLLKDNLTSAMQTLSKYKADLGLFKLSFRKSEALQELPELDLDQIPDNFKKVTVALDKTNIKKAIKAGQNFPGLAIVEKQNLQVK
jgi:hypothetical protein